MLGKVCCSELTLPASCSAGLRLVRRIKRCTRVVIVVVAVIGAGIAPFPGWCDELIGTPGLGHVAAVSGCQSLVSGSQNACVDAVYSTETHIWRDAVGTFITVYMLFVSAGVENETVEARRRQCPAHRNAQVRGLRGQIAGSIDAGRARVGALI